MPWYSEVEGADAPAPTLAAIDIPFIVSGWELVFPGRSCCASMLCALR